MKIVIKNKVTDDVEDKYTKIKKKRWEKMIKKFTEIGFKLYTPYQTDGCDWMLKRELKPSYHNAGLLCDECGLGKTIQTCATMWTNRVKATLIVVPKCVITQWSDILKKIFSEQSVYVHHGVKRVKTLEELKKKLTKKVNFVVTTYGMLVQRRRKNVPMSIEGTVIQQYDWDRMVCDEIHLMRNRHTRQSKAVQKVSAKIVWGLTGTPVQNSISDLKTLYKCLKFPSSYFESGTDDCYAYLNRKYILRRTKREVVDMVGEIPDIDINVVKVPFRTKIEKKLYREICNQIIKLEDDMCAPPFAIIEKYLRLRQICIHPQIYLDGTSKKFDVALKPWNKISTKFQVLSEMMEKHIEEKSLVFCYFKTEMDMLQFHLESIGWKVFRIEGGQTLDTRLEQIKQAKECGEKTVVLIQIQAGSVGMNLQFASRVYYTSPNWNPSVEIQANARAHRIGQERPVKVVKLVIQDHDTVEDKILERQIMKRGIMARVLRDEELLDNGNEVMVR